MSMAALAGTSAKDQRRYWHVWHIDRRISWKRWSNEYAAEKMTPDPVRGRKI